MKKKLLISGLLLAGIVCIGLVAKSFYDLGYTRGRNSLFAQKESTVEEKSVNSKKIRIPLFLDPKNVKHRTRFLFTYDPPESLEEFNNTYKLKTIAGNTDEFHRILNIMKWVRNLWEPSTPKIYPPVNAMVIIDAIKSGKTGGFCAQYNYVFVQALQSLGIKARYVTLEGHEVTEVFINDFNKWILFDPSYALVIKDNQNYLSVYEIFAKVRQGKQDELKVEPYISRILQENREMYFNKYKIFAVWIKNDHSSSPVNFTDINRYRVYYIESYDDFFKVPFGTLFTFYKEDLYL